MTDLDGLPHAYRHSLWVLRQARAFSCLPRQIEEEGQELIGHFEREKAVAEALKRYR